MTLEELLATWDADPSLMCAIETGDEMAKRLRAVAALHARCGLPEEPAWCGECNDDNGGGVDWPCPTYRALSGEGEPDGR